MHRLIGFTLTILLSSCAMTNANNYTQTVQNWRGNKLHNLLSQWGAPDLTIPGTKGYTVYLYQTVNERHSGLPTAPVVGIHTSHDGKPVFITPPNNAWSLPHTPFNCYTTFTVDTHQVIVDARVHGQGCYGAKVSRGR